MASKAGPKIASDGIVLHLDAYINDSYAGERLDGNTNLANNTNDYTGSSYGASSEWSSNATQFTKTYHAGVKTPIGKGATMIQESGGTGYHHLSRYGGSEMSGSHTVSFYFRPLSDDWGDDLRVGMLGDSSNGGAYFNLNTGVGYAVGGTSTDSRLVLIKKLKGGWWFIACDFHGRSGGWVGCLGSKIHTSYTGTVGAKKAYICGINYNNKSYAIPSFDRSGDSGYWQDLSPHSNHGDMTNMNGTPHETHYRNGEVILPTSHAYISLDGTDDHISVADDSTLDITGDMTMSCWVALDSSENGNLCMIANKRDASDYTAPYYMFFEDRSGQNKYGAFLGGGSPNYIAVGSNDNFDGVYGKWDHVCFTVSGTTVSMYVNGAFDESGTFTGSRQTNNVPLKIGGPYTDGMSNYMMAGRIANLLIYNKALTASEIKSNFNAHRSRFGI